ncbi:hypothetical protein ELS19_18070 [Halogeometricum borinquense]|uniref:Uncharacterized protein n=1 Tax=Halogeometricum borinquense TaxID=60847 RepID=A0A482T6C0_9EURY|nr:hypothetical protein [Halogeometricum borinquense]RYJ08437.1 hypothetical protein ELS19_18070 [Halogeometricum borinquense]
MLREILSVARADFKERSRTVKWLVVPVILAYFAKLVTVDMSLVIAEEYTGVPTAGWYGAMLSVMGTLVILIFGFVIVGGSLARDKKTNVDQLIATSQLSNISYLSGKIISNFLLLASITITLAILTGVTFLIQGTGKIDVWALFSPFLLGTLPTMALVAAVVVFFESNRFLQKTTGNILYMFVAIWFIYAVSATEGFIDVAAINIFRDSMGQAIAAQYPSFDGNNVGFLYTNSAEYLKPFQWSGVNWTMWDLLSRIPILGVSAVFFGLSYLSFNRFDSTDRWSIPHLKLPTIRSSSSKDSESDLQAGTQIEPNSTDIEIESLSSVTQSGIKFHRVLLSEFRLMIRGQPWWWYLACVLAFVGSLIPSTNALRSVVIPLALLLPLSLWSELGTRTKKYQTEELVFATSGPNILLAASYVAAVLVGFILTAPAGIRFLFTGAFSPLFGWAVGLLFLPAAALASGVWSGQSRLFEISYLLAWYFGPMNDVLPLDYIGASNETVTSGITLVYLVLTIIALGAAIYGRRMDTRNG